MTPPLVHSAEINGIPLEIEDEPGSVTVPFIFRELNADNYGLEKIELGPDDTFLDVGANVGITSIYAHLKFGCNVIAFEPVPATFWHMKANLQRNGVDESKFKLFNFAVTDSDTDIVEIHYQPAQSGNASAFTGSAKALACPTMRLRKFLDPNPPKYWKADCEGAEHLIIEDCKDLLWAVPYIGIEFHRFAPGPTPEELLTRLENLTTAKIFHSIAS